MGIPGLFKNCIQKYHNISGNKIIETIIREIIKRRSITDNSNENEPEFTEEPVKNRLFLDFNCAIYYVLKPEMKDINTLIIYTLDYLDTLCSLIPNLEFVYIALDGVPPRAKIRSRAARPQQHGTKEQRALKINEEYGDDLDKTDYNFHIDTNMITPGTEFMKKLTESIRNHIATSKLYQNAQLKSPVCSKKERKYKKNQEILNKILPFRQGCPNLTFSFSTLGYRVRKAGGRTNQYI